MKENVLNDPKYLKEFVLQILFLALKVTRFFTFFCDFSIDVFLWKNAKLRFSLWFFGEFTRARHRKKMKNINPVTLWLHISFSRATSSSQKMPNFSLEKLQQSWCAASRRKNLPKRRQFPLLMISDALT